MKGESNRGIHKLITCCIITTLVCIVLFLNVFRPFLWNHLGIKMKCSEAILENQNWLISILRKLHVKLHSKSKIHEETFNKILMNILAYIKIRHDFIKPCINVQPILLRARNPKYKWNLYEEDCNELHVTKIILIILSI